MKRFSSASMRDTALTNAVIDASSNSITNLTLVNLTSSSLTTDLTVQQSDNSTLPSAKSVIEFIHSSVSAANHFRGTLDLSSGDYPATSTGSGNNSIVAGDWWRVTVPGAFGTASAPTTNTEYIEAGDVVIAVSNYSNTNGLTNNDFLVVQGNLISASHSEAIAKTSAKYLTPSSVSDFLLMKKIEMVSNGATTTQYTITHDLNTPFYTLHTTVMVYNATTGSYDKNVVSVVENTTDNLNKLDIVFSAAPPAGTFYVNVMGLYVVPLLYPNTIVDLSSTIPSASDVIVDVVVLPNGRVFYIRKTAFGSAHDQSFLHEYLPSTGASRAITVKDIAVDIDGNPTMLTNTFYTPLFIFGIHLDGSDLYATYGYYPGNGTSVGKGICKLTYVDATNFSATGSTPQWFENGIGEFDSRFNRVRIVGNYLYYWSNLRKVFKVDKGNLGTVLASSAGTDNTFLGGTSITTDSTYLYYTQSSGNIKVLNLSDLSLVTTISGVYTTVVSANAVWAAKLSLISGNTYNLSLVKLVNNSVAATFTVPNFSTDITLTPVIKARYLTRSGKLSVMVSSSVFSGGNNAGDIIFINENVTSNADLVVGILPFTSNRPFNITDGITNDFYVARATNLAHLT